MGRPKKAAAVEPEVCARCGQHHERCSGHANIYDNGNYKTGTKIGERPCMHWPMHGQRICQTHGGRGRNRVAGARQWKKEKAIKTAMTQLDKQVKTLGLPVVTTPQQALLDEIYRTAGHVKWLSDQVAALQTDELGWGRQSEEKRTGVGEMETNIDLTTTVMGARANVLYEMYTRERAHLVHVAKVAIQCGIAERQIKLAEEQGRLIADAFRELIESPELQLTAVQVTLARTVASKVLRSMAMPHAVLPASNGHIIDQKG